MFENIEPHADIRKAATVSWEVYVAYQQAGFSDEQAFTLTKAILTQQQTS